MRYFALVILSLATLLPTSASTANDSWSLAVQIEGLRNAEGAVQVSLYNTKGSIPDRKFKHFYRQEVIPLTNAQCNVRFDGLPPGTYAISVHHDENKDGKINRTFVFPVEGVGFSNYASIGLSNRPSFSGASFELSEDTEKSVKMVYF